MVSFFEITGASGSLRAILSPLGEELLKNGATQMQAGLTDTGPVTKSQRPGSRIYSGQKPDLPPELFSYPQYTTNNITYLNQFECFSITSTKNTNIYLTLNRY